MFVKIRHKTVFGQICGLSTNTRDLIMFVAFGKFCGGHTKLALKSSTHTNQMQAFRVGKVEICLKSCSNARCLGALSPRLSCLPSFMGIWWSISR